MPLACQVENGNFWLQTHAVVSIDACETKMLYKMNIVRRVNVILTDIL